jgi:uncharacterized protein (DUF2235 family)
VALSGSPIDIRRLLTDSHAGARGVGVPGGLSPLARAAPAGSLCMKKIVVFADGTWNSPEEGRPTHVLQMAQAACQPDQVVFYDWGVGTEGQRIAGGVSGAGIDKNIMDCYRFVVHNYEPDDRLYFFGFSRGAYTV